MRKVSAVSTEADALLDQKLGVYESELQRHAADLQSRSASVGLGVVCQSQSAQNAAMYQSICTLLKEVQENQDEGKYAKYLACFSAAAVDVLRDGESPAWKRLALATVLEVVLKCFELEAS